MAEQEFMHEAMEKVSLCPLSEKEEGKGVGIKQVSHGFHLVKGPSSFHMEDYVAVNSRQVDDHELGLFAIFDGHLSHSIPNYLCSNLFDNILSEHDFWTDPESAVRRAYAVTDSKILDKESGFGNGGSTAVAAIIVDSQKLIVSNIGDSRAVICKNGKVKQLSVDHDPSVERESIHNRGGFVTKFPGDVCRVDGKLAVARAFGDRQLKNHMSCDPDVAIEIIDDNTDVLILASDGLWTVMSNEEAVDSIKGIDDPHVAAKHLIDQALVRKSDDDISCIVITFH